MKKILIIVTSHAEMENTESKTGLWLGEFTDPYYEFIDAGYEVTIASPLGGETPIDPMSTLTENITESNRRFQEDATVKQKLSNTVKLSEVDADTFDALFVPGGHGPMWDLANDKKTGSLILEFMNEGKPVGAVCHGPAALLAAAMQQPDLLKGRRITAFTNAEELLVFRSDNIPYKLETRLKELGAQFQAALLPFFSNVETDGLLVTGQNPASAGPAAKALMEMLEGQ